MLFRSLDELPTLAALRDMDTLGVQLELPGDGSAASGSGGEPDVSGGADLSAAGVDLAVDEEAGDDEEPSTPVSRNPGLVAAPAEADDSDSTPERY